MKLAALLISLSLTYPAAAQMTVDQRVFDFQVLASLYAKRYAPLEWKRKALGTDISDIAPWLTRVRAANDDIEFLELCKEYVASFDDGHTSFRAPGSLRADSGLFTDIYDGKVYIDGVNRTTLPLSRYPIAVGDEVISIDGKPVEEVLAGITRLVKLGSPSATRRYAAGLLTFRPISDLPRTVQLGDTFDIVLRQESGEIRSFTIPWVKAGFAPAKIGPVPSPRTAASEEAEEPGAALLRAWNQNAQWKVPASRGLFSRFENLARDQGEIEGWVLGWGSRAPTFALPTGFTQRLGRLAADFHFSGTYVSEGKRIGYLRIPSFSPSSAANAQRELAGEVAFFRLNTDGLVVDVQRNPGGGCYMLTAALYLIPRKVWFFGQELRPTIDLISGLQASLDLARQTQSEQWVIDTIRFQLGLVKDAYAENRGMTGAIPACAINFDVDPLLDQNGQPLAYDKPLIVLIDEFSTSAADIFPAMMQDNQRGPLVGTRTTGAGGSVSLWDTGFYMEATASNTNSLVTRREIRAPAGYPASNYIENVGAHPDIPLERMTLENLRSGGRQFADGFSRIIVQEINKAAP
jgi:hypothetical protein